MRSLILLFFLLLLCSCAKTNTEATNEAIDLALTYLTEEKCDQAIDVLEEVGRDKSNAIYLQVLASAYSCRAGFNEITFLADDLSQVDATTAFLTSLTKLTLSPESEANSSKYNDMREAFSILTQVDSNQPNQDNREIKFGANKAADMGIQALFLGLTQLGKFLHFYGNVDSTGAKGAGAASTDEQGATVSNCFIEYTEASSLAFLAAGGGACVANSMVGHPNLSLLPASLTATKKKMCEGLVLVTNLLDILENMTLPSNSAFDAIRSLPTNLVASRDAIIAVKGSVATLLGTTSQSKCESLVADATEFDNLQFIYAGFFEGGLQ